MVVVSSITPKNRQNTLKNLMTKRGTLWVISHLEIPYGSIHLPTCIVVRCIDVIFQVGTAPVNLEYLSVTITTCCLPGAVLGSGPNIPMAAKSIGPEAENI